MEKWKTLSTESGPDLRLFRAFLHQMENPRNGIISPKVVLSGPDAANCVVITPKEEIVFVKQYRFGIDEFTLELPGGLVETNEDPKDSAIREIQEETGYRSDQISLLGKIASNPVFMDCWIYHFIAKGATQRFEVRQDPGEDIETILIPKEKVYEMIKNGEFIHPHTISALALFFLQQ
jgi:8-oxo-dGTP pyrophosphatase MutT (NUDIX family)